jgi:hypothetical protein
MKKVRGLSLTFSRRLDERVKRRLGYKYHVDSHMEENGRFTPNKDYEEIFISEDTREALMGNIDRSFEENSLNKLREYSEDLGKLFLKEDILNDLRKNDGYIIIESNDDNIPWQILYPSYETKQDGFLGLTYPLTFIPKVSILRKKIVEKEDKRAILISDPTADIGLQNIKEEIVGIKEILERNHITVECIPTTRKSQIRSKDIMKILKSGMYDIFHFTGHGNYERGMVWLDLFGGSSFDHSTLASIGGLSNSPLFFFNACYSGAPSDYYFDDAFRATTTLAPLAYQNGAKAFIGAMNPIRNDIAKDFAIEFYESFVDRKRTLGSSIFDARRYIFNKHKSVFWASYVCYGHPNLLFFGDLSGKKEEKPQENLLYGSDLYFCKNAIDSINSGLNWLLINEDIWIRDVHKTAEVLNLIKKVNPELIKKMPEHHLHWFRTRLNDLFYAWLENRGVVGKDIGICGECDAASSCNYFCYSYIEDFLTEEIRKKIIRKFLEKMHDHLWYVAECEGFDTISPAVSALVVELLTKEREIFAVVSDMPFQEYITDCVKKIIEMQNSDGSWNPPFKTRSSKPQEYYEDDSLIETTEVILSLKGIYLMAPREDKRLIEHSLRRAKKYFLKEKQKSGDMYWWDCKSHYEDRNKSIYSDIRGTSYAIESMISCNVNPFSDIVMGAISWLINHQQPYVQWPLDTRYAGDSLTTSSVEHAISALHTWLKSFFERTLNPKSK